ncbi:MAG TPA: patatin-like phospholipase family protein [Candidatus Margulisiibacteriota bacterium]|nr:patatin-like phospholipase family protein [Candidatus Margulisiibacteriota bacterium]
MSDTARTAAVERATAIAKGSTPLPGYPVLKDLVRDLKGELQFGRARKLIAAALGRDGKDSGSARQRFSPEEELWLMQQLALCTYKDEELLPGARFRDALKVLTEIGLRDPQTTNAETLALGGAVYKRKFEFAGQLDDLQESLALYRAGWERRPVDEPYVQERPYSAVNAAYVLDLLATRAAAIAHRSGTTSTLAASYAQQAAQLRADALTYLRKHFHEPTQPTGTYWDAVTWAEAYLGAKEYAAAEPWLTYARENLPSEWEQQTTFKQLVGLARLQQVGMPQEGSSPVTWSPAWRALHAFLGDATETALSCYRGKVGLALSGGGFRASLFHLGVLARLAEMDVLRFVEVLSTVSGGSIVGAHYYLEVQRLLERRRDRQIAREDYIRIVRRVQRKFFHGVRKNLRMRALSNLGCNLRMLMTDSYTRSHRLGELYERELFVHIQDDKQDGARTMPQLLVTPAAAAATNGFNPRFSNWQRRAKVPVLLLNATSLNSGHNWQFTASWMGEPPGLFEPEADIDANVRYRRLYYGEAPTKPLKTYRLGYAVAASACVPGLFEPLVLNGLYPGRTVRLVDGGVHDNQGVESLLDEGCTLILCSDASGQMEDIERPSDTFIGVPLRSNSILQDRIREAEYQDLRGRVENRALQGLFFVHLKKGLTVAPLDWIDCKEPTPVPQRSLATTDYGVDRDIQRCLAAIRTDLDSFTEVEAYALMASGYLMTEGEFRSLQSEHRQSGASGTWGDFQVDAPRGRWPFLRLADLMRQPADSADCRRRDLALQLRAGSGLLFKVWMLVPWLRALAISGAVGVAVLLTWLMFRTWDSPLPALQWHVTVGHAVVALLLLVVATVYPVLKWLSPQSAVRGYLGKAAVALAGWVASNVHLLIFDRLYLARGRLRRLLRLQ